MLNNKQQDKVVILKAEDSFDYNELSQVLGGANPMECDCVCMINCNSNDVEPPQS